MNNFVGIHWTDYIDLFKVRRIYYITITLYIYLIFLLLPLFSDHWIASFSFLPQCPMTTRITYSTSDSRQIFDNCRRFSYPGASNFLQALPARSSPFFKAPNKHRRGWQVALRSQSLRKLSIPSLISLNARSLLNKIDDLRSLLLSRLYHNTGVILVQESWLSNSIDNELLNVANFSAYRADRPNSKKVRSGGLVTYVHNE